MLIFGIIKSNDRFLLVIHGTRASQEDIEKCVLRYYDGKAVMRVNNTTTENAEYIYELSSRIIKKAEPQPKKINDLLYSINGVKAVNLVCQNEEINR